jgi:hydrogenase small subunit
MTYLISVGSFQHIVAGSVEAFLLVANGRLLGAYASIFCRAGPVRAPLTAGFMQCRVIPPTGCMGLQDYLGHDWRSRAGLPIVNVPGCPVQPDNFMETLLYLLRQLAGVAPMIPVDDLGRPRWPFGNTVHNGCDRAAYYEQADFTKEYGSPKCLVKIGCWGPVVQCNVPKRRWISGMGGCPNVGGICIGCTMPGFPDKFMPFMDEPPGAVFSSGMIRPYGMLIRRLRRITNNTLNDEPKWRHNRAELTTGYRPDRPIPRRVGTGA